MKYNTVKPRVILPLTGLVGIAFLVLVGKALQPAHETPGLPGAAGPGHGPGPAKPSPAPWECLTVRDVEEALEEGDSTEDILRALRSRLEAYARRVGDGSSDGRSR